MTGKSVAQNCLAIFLIVVFLFVTPHILFSGNNKQPVGKTYSGKGSTLDEAIRKATQTAIADIGILDGEVNFSLKEVRGRNGGLAPPHYEIEAFITIQEEKPSTLCTEALEFQAYLKDNVVTVIAFGSHNTAGWQVMLKPEAVSDSTIPRFILKHTPPTGPVAQVITPFVVSADFRTGSSPKSIIVMDGNGQHNVPTKSIK